MAGQVAGKIRRRRGFGGMVPDAPRADHLHAWTPIDALGPGAGRGVVRHIPFFSKDMVARDHGLYVGQLHFTRG